MRTIAIISTFILNWTFLIAQPTSIDSLKKEEKLITQLKKQFTLTEYDRPDILMPFNKDTIVIAGYLSDYKVGNSPKNVIYRTKNGGLTWEIIKFTGDAWIYCSHYEKDGKIWMGGSDEFVHYSNDFGAHWKKLAKPFSPSDRILSIYMTDTINGIAGGLSNGLSLTTNNWATRKQIQSPLDQHKFKLLKSSAGNRVDKIEILDSTILINQNSHIYYSKLDPIIWKEFNIPVCNFSADETTKQWSIYSLGNKVYVLSSKLDLIKTYTKASEFYFYNETPNTTISFADFFSSERITLNIKAVTFDFDKMSGGSLQYPIYKENIMEMKVNDTNKTSSLKEILNTTNKYNKPLFETFSFTGQDFASYEDFYNKLKRNRKEEKEWGGDYSYLLNIENDHFVNPKHIVANINQSLIDSVYKKFSFNEFLIKKDEPFIILNLVNSNSDTLKITSENSTLYSLPWTLEYNGQTFQTYDTRITNYLRTLIPKDYNYYDKLFAGELIYRLIEQRTIDELEYKNGY